MLSLISLEATAAVISAVCFKCVLFGTSRWHFFFKQSPKLTKSSSSVKTINSYPVLNYITTSMLYLEVGAGDLNPNHSQSLSGWGCCSIILHCLFLTKRVWGEINTQSLSWSFLPEEENLFCVSYLNTQNTALFHVQPNAISFLKTVEKDTFVTMQLSSLLIISSFEQDLPWGTSRIN